MISIKNDICGSVVAWEWDELPLPCVYDIKKIYGKQHKQYYDIVCAFDIETTTVRDSDNNTHGFMYLWQFCLEDQVCMGRTWNEFLLLLDRLENHFNLYNSIYLVIYVHNLGYEMQFLSGYLPICNVFATDTHKPLYFTIGNFELRCSWKLSNMALGKFLTKTPGVTFYKQDDNFDYTKVRTPITKLTDDELFYGYCDVRGLCQAIRSKLIDDDLGSIPLTSTGYVRNKARNAMRNNPDNHDLFVKMRLTPEEYAFCRQARRGGNTHCNYSLAGEILTVGSFDKKSSYPASMIMDLFPMTPFAEFSRKAIDNPDYALLIYVTFESIIIKHSTYIPYIATSKCINPDLRNTVADNGRIMYGRNLTMVLTDIDYHIIMDTYDVQGILIHKIFGAQYGKLPDELRYAIMDDFKQKCVLETGDKYLYDKFKNQLNAYFGMMLTDMLHTSYQFTAGKWEPPVKPDPYEGLKKYYKGRNNFLSYQWGLWVTANARYELQLAINEVGRDCVYVDTDSCKYIGDHHDIFERLNARLIKKAENNDIPAYVDYAGKRTYLGKWEYEGTKQFRSWGAKKYATEDKEGFKITVAGLSKADGAGFFKSLDNFVPGTVVDSYHSGRLTMKYNVVETPFKILVDGCEIEIRNNVAAIPSTYTLSTTEEYADLIGYDEDLSPDGENIGMDLTRLQLCDII